MDFTDEKFKEAVRTCTSVAGVLRTLSRAQVGTNYRLVRQKIAHLGLDTSHWKTGAFQPGISTEDLFVENSTHSRTAVRKRIRRDNLIPQVCESCGLGPEWNGRPLVLRLDHRNGIRNDDRRDNLRFLCPNCDSQTETFCGRNRPHGSKVHTCPCGRAIHKKSLACRSCAAKKQPSKISWPSPSELLRRLEASSFVSVAGELGVSDNAIRKHLRNLPQ